MIDSTEQRGIWLGQLSREELIKLDGHEVGDKVVHDGKKWIFQWSNYHRAFYLEPDLRMEYMH